MPEKPTAIFLMGPTASGKSELAIELAERLSGEIVSVDSALVYRDMDIGTAKPSVEQRQQVPHHLIDILDPSQVFSTGEFRDRALDLIQQIDARGCVPILVGGTMLYFNALLTGLANLPTADPAIRAQIETEAVRRGWAYVHAQLAAVDPEAAARIHVNDPQRIQRALEVYRISGEPLTRLCAKSSEPVLNFTPIRVIVAPKDRASLHRKIEQRFLMMMEQGLLEEVRQLRKRGNLHAGLPAMRAVGYRQVWSYLEGFCTREEMIERAVIATRQLAKRQFTWLRKQEAQALCVESGQADLSSGLIRALRPKLQSFSINGM